MALAKPAKPAVTVFRFDDSSDDGPELDISGAANKASTKVSGSSTPKVEQGVDLSGKKKIIFFVGRGKTGKTTGIRWLAETAIASDRVLLMADMDSTNDSFSQYIDGVSRPSDPSNPAIALKWLDRLLQHALQTGTSLLVDLGGGDTTLRRLVTQLPDLVSLFEEAGFAVIVFYTVGPQEEDLSPLATMMGLDFQPTAMAIVLNEAMAEIGESRETAFARIFHHSAFRTAVGRGAVPVWMPRLLPAQAVEIRRLPFRDAVEGRTGQGKTGLGPFDRSRVFNWLRTMDTNFSGIKTWLP
jgi:hypothetical protein